MHRTPPSAPRIAADPDASAAPRLGTRQGLRTGTAFSSPPTGGTSLDWALAYSEIGWRVLPLHTALRGQCTCNRPADCYARRRAGKHPAAFCFDGKHWTTCGSSDVRTIERWWDRCLNPPGRGRSFEPNVGIATGYTSRLWVLDLDRRDDVDGLATLRSLAAGRDYTTTAQRTGSGGFQLVYAWPEEWQLAGRSITSRSSVLPGIDVRGEGGLFVAPPSVHLTEERYAWHAEHDPWEFEPAMAPDWLLDLVAVAAPVAGEPRSSRRSSMQPRARASNAHRVQEALTWIDPCPRDEWLTIGMVLRSTHWSDARAMWDEWSARCPEKYSDAAQETAWQSFNREDGVGLGTLFWRAKRARESSSRGGGRGRRGGAA